MPQSKSSQFFKSLSLCIFALLIIIGTGIGVVRYMDRHLPIYNELIDISGQQRMLSQRISLKSSLLIEQCPSLQCDDIIVKLLAAIKKHQEIQDEIKELITIHDGLQNARKKFLNTQNDGYSYEEILAEYDKNIGTINHYLRNEYSKNTVISSNIKNIITEKLIPKNDIILSAFYTQTKFFRSYIDSHINERQITRFILVAFFTFLIFLIVLISFYPMQKNAKELIHQINQQKTIYEDERNRLYLASKATVTGIWDWDIETGGFHWNDVLKEILGINEEGNAYDVTYFQSLLHPDDKEAFNNAIYNHIKTKETFLHESRLRHSDGHYIWTRFRGQAQWNEDGRAYRMTGSVQDYTESKETEIQRDIFIQGIEATNIAFAIIDHLSATKNFTYASPAFCELTGYSYHKLLHSNIGVFTGPETSMVDLDRIDYALKNKEELSIKMLHYRYDGSPYHNQVTLRPIFINEQFSNYFIVIFNDLTDEIKNKKQEIERQRNESLGTLAGSVAHEINNLLMPMTMAEDILEDALKDDCDDFAREQIKTITQYANQAKEIVQGILTFSRKETGNLKKVKLYDELKESVQFIQSLLSSKTKLTIHDTKHQNIDAMINQTEMKQIITNLCKNAEQAFEGNSGTIDINFDITKPSKEEKKRLDIIASEFALISIADNGKGIAEENISKIFEPLFTTKAVGQGTGLGLSVVIGIIRSWGGAITVDSVLGQGTTFNIYIPVYKDNDDFSDLMELVEDLESNNIILPK